MIDHLLTFATEADAIRALPQFRTRHGWASSAVPVRIVIDPGEYTDIFEPTEYREIGVWFTPELTAETPDPEPEWIGTNHYEAVIPEGAQLEPTEVRAPVEAAGYHLMVAAAEIDAALRDLPDHACRLIADRAAAARGETFLRYTAADLSAEVLAVATVTPTFAGSRYPFGAV